MRRFFGYIEADEIPSVLWDSGPNPDGWKDFVELAKSAGAAFLTMHAWVLEREELDRLSKRLGDGEYTSEEDLEESRWLKTYVGKTGFLQLGWAHQGLHVRLRSGYRMVRPLPAPARVVRRRRRLHDRRARSGRRSLSFHVTYAERR